jgi:ATP-dependent helicase/nuclease subunit A
MSSIAMRPTAPDQPLRDSALDPARSILVQAPAGSGKTDLLTRRFLRLLAEVDSPEQIVAITFTKAAAAEMRIRILSELDKAERADGAVAGETVNADEFSMEALARRALSRSRALGWSITDLPGQLRISTIDSFCRELALQQPLLSGLGGGLETREQARDLYRQAARRTLQQIDDGNAELQAAIRALLTWRDNNWSELENQLVDMLDCRNKWMHYFVVGANQDWDAVRERLERPFVNALRKGIAGVNRLLDQVAGGRQEALELARFACGKSGGTLHRELAELADFPVAPFVTPDELEDARRACICLADLVLNRDGFRKRVDKRHGFPPECKQEKTRLLELIAKMRLVSGLEPALQSIASMPPAQYSEADWAIVRACFTVMREAAAQLKVVFAESGEVDFTEVAQVAENVLRDEEAFPTEAALVAADQIRHLLIDEFQDTSRRQHALLAGLIGAWPDTAGRTCFLVGDPMQSIYFFRDADTELFANIRYCGLKFSTGDEPLRFDTVALRANFRTAPQLVDRLNKIFSVVFAVDDGSGIEFSPAEAARERSGSGSAPRFKLHMRFEPQGVRKYSGGSAEAQEREFAESAQMDEIVALIRDHLPAIETTRAENEQRTKEQNKKYRVAVLGRTKKMLASVAAALHDAQIPFRAVELENLSERPEVLDALALARALLNPHDRLSWLGVLRAPWCGLSLSDLHALTSADDPALLARPIPELLSERAHLLSSEGRQALARVVAAIGAESGLRFSRPAASLGTWLQQVWMRLGGEACADDEARANLDLLWKCLDDLPDGGQDLLGPELDAALRNLNGQSDPGVSSDCGVQLMTIHKSKGQEFEVVIMPEMQHPERGSSFKMLSWLERGLVEPDESGEVTEFLVAPFQPKGDDRGKAKEWVECVYREREKQEMRRLLYVTATRAREELHFFAQARYKELGDSAPELVEPEGSLLATAWPALKAEVVQQFDEWIAARAAAEPEPATIESLAASGDPGNLIEMRSRVRPVRVRRLPLDYRVPRQSRVEVDGVEAIAGGARAQLYARHEGGIVSRALGNAIHLLLEQLALLRTSMDWDAACARLRTMEPRVVAEARALGLSPDEAGDAARHALRHALDASGDANGAWILSPHREAESEARWTGVVDGQLRSVRVDRIFQAGPAPQTEGDDCWWIVDYKTAHPESVAAEAMLANLRGLFAPQLEAYAEVLRKLRPDGKPIRAGLYYPLMRALDWWAIEP